MHFNSRNINPAPHCAPHRLKLMLQAHETHWIVPFKLRFAQCSCTSCTRNDFHESTRSGAIFEANCKADVFKPHLLHLSFRNTCACLLLTIRIKSDAWNYFRNQKKLAADRKSLGSGFCCWCGKPSSALTMICYWNVFEMKTISLVIRFYRPLCNRLSVPRDMLWLLLSANKTNHHLRRYQLVCVTFRKSSRNSHAHNGKSLT